jgi:hypothetical protein
MITIFGDLHRFCTPKSTLFLITFTMKNQFCINGNMCVKIAIFSPIFSPKILTNHNNGPPGPDSGAVRVRRLPDLRLRDRQIRARRRKSGRRMRKLLRGNFDRSEGQKYQEL